MSLFGPLLSLGSSLLGGFLNNKAADDRQEDAQSFNSAQFASRYQTTMEDMRKAGLNPGLAYGGISGSPNPAGIASSAGYPDLGSSVNEGFRQASQVKLQSAQMANIEADTANKAAQGKLYEAQAAAAYGSADQAFANVRLIGETVNKIMAEVPNIRDTNLNIAEQRYVLKNTVEMLAQQANLMKEQGKNQEYIRSNLEATIGKLKSETALNSFSIEAANNMGNLGRELGQLAPIFELIKAMILRK